MDRGRTRRRRAPTPGKLADLVIFENNPLQFPSDTIGDIAVLETIKGGKTIWRRGEKRAEHGDERFGAPSSLRTLPGRSMIPL